MTVPAPMLAKALKHHQDGGLNRARRMYRRILAAEPDNADALHMLGVASLQVGRLDEAEKQLRQAIQLAPGRAEFHNDLGETLTARHQYPEAQKCFEEAVRLRPDYAEAFNNLGRTHHVQNRTAAALKMFFHAMRLRPDFAEPFNHAGIIAFKENQPGQAILFFEKALRLVPDYADARSNLGLVYLAQDKLDDAIRCFRDALRLKPDYAGAYNNLGIAHLKRSQAAEALACFHEAIRLDAQSAEAHNNAGNVLRLAERNTEALTYYQKALQLNPYHFEAQTNLGKLLCEQGRHAEAVAGFEQALTYAPNDGLKLLSLLTLPVIYESNETVLRHRRRFETNLARLAQEKLTIDDPVRQTGNLVFYLVYQGMNDRQPMSDLAGLFGRAVPSLRYTAPHCLAPDAAENRPIRVGFISNHFFNHTIARLNGGIIRELARNPRFHVTAFALQPRDDEWSRFVRDSAHRHLVLPQSLAGSRQAIAEERLDVLYYTDIGMDPVTYYLAFARLAPVQCVTWGHPNTTGLPTMDYFLSARDLDPEDGDNQYTERLVRMENLNTYFYALQKFATRPRSFFGLTEEDHLYACPQSLFKFHPEFDAYLGDILRRDPRGRLVLVAGHHDYWQTLLRERFRRSFGSAADRIIVLPRLGSADFLALLAAADAILDPLPFGGGLSSHEAFLVGSPVVTQPGDFLRGRITYACYRRMGLMDCVASNREEYVDIALRLANDRDWGADVRSRLADARTALLENRGVIRELEEFLPAALRRAVEGSTGRSN